MFKSGRKCHKCGGQGHKPESSQNSREKMFCGEYNHTIDPKGRLIIPAKFRESLGEEFKITRDIEGKCLYIYSMEGWNTVEEQIKQLPSDAMGMRLKRILIGGAQDVELDKQGRILIPAAMRKLARLEKDVVLAGIVEHIEIWDMQSWKDEIAPENIGDLGDVVQTYGLHL